MKYQFDLDLFWSLPRIKDYLIYEDPKGIAQPSYCAFGASLKAFGFQDLAISIMSSIAPNHPALMHLKHKDCNRFALIWETNDGKEGVNSSNPELAKRMLLDWLIEEDLIEYKEPPAVFTAPVKEECSKV
jgi:hypothetical protein